MPTSVVQATSATVPSRLRVLSVSATPVSSNSSIASRCSDQELFPIARLSIGGVGAVGDFVVDRERHVHELSGCEAAVIGEAVVGYCADSHDAALARDDDGDERVYAECAEIADSYAGGFEVG